MPERLSTCCFCDAPVGRSVGAGRVFVADYCLGCKQLYDAELGPGWQYQEWAKAAFKSHRQLMHADRKEGTYIRLDKPVAINGIQSGATIGDHISADKLAERPTRRKVSPSDNDIITAEIERLISEKMGGDKVHRELKAQGWDICQRSVYYRIAKIKQDAPVSQSAETSTV